MTTRELQRYGRTVMRRLDMPEWVKRADFRMASNLKNKDGPCDGLSSWHPEERLSWIWVNRGQSLKAQQTSCIHECLHILYEGHLQPMEEYDEGYELGLNRTAETLWNAWHA